MSKKVEEIYAFPPIPGKVMNLGSRAVTESLNMGFPYTNPKGLFGNDFWYCISPLVSPKDDEDRLYNLVCKYIDQYNALNDEQRQMVKLRPNGRYLACEYSQNIDKSINELRTTQKQVLELLGGKIGLADLIDYCKATGAADKDTDQDSIAYDFKKLRRLFIQSKLIVLNGGYSSKSSVEPLNLLNDIASKSEGLIAVNPDTKNRNHVGETGRIVLHIDEGDVSVPYISIVSTSGLSSPVNVSAYKGKYMKKSAESPRDFKRRIWLGEITEKLQSK